MKDITAARSRRSFTRLALVALTLALAAGCTLAGENTAETEGRTVKLVVHDSFAVDQASMDKFRAETGIRIQPVPSGDAGELTNKLVLTKDNPIGDVAYGVDSTYASRALNENVFASYRSPAADNGPQRYALGNNDHVTAVDEANVCVNIDHGWFAQRGVPAPRTLRDLTDPRYRDQLVVEDPSTSSPGLAFLLNTVATFGENGWQDYWRKLRANGVKIASGWEEAYNQDFSGSSGKGPRPIVVSYASSPAAEIGQDGRSHTSALPDTCYRQVEYAGVLAGAKDPDAARKVVDFLLSPEFQRQVPTQMYVYPARGDVALPPEWPRVAPRPERSAELPPDQVERNRQRWIEQWRNLVR